MRNPHVPPGFWRGVNLNQNAIYLECFIDEVAACHPAGPAGLRRKLMAGTRSTWPCSTRWHSGSAGAHAAAERPGVFRGLAQTMGFGSYVAACAEVSVNKDGTLTVHRIVAATDCGHAVNPQQIEAQVEGSFAYGLSAALYGECTVKDGRIVQRTSTPTRCCKMAQMPRSRPSWCLRAASGGAWASPPSRWLRRRCSTRSSRPPAGASATCR
jgi:isoquinoline 1-oxidoreductase beta subunit